jgi:hypothetical protein
LYSEASCSSDCSLSKSRHCFFFKTTMFLQAHQDGIQAYAPPCRTTGLRIVRRSCRPTVSRVRAGVAKCRLLHRLFRRSTKDSRSGVGYGANSTTSLPLLNPAGRPMLNVRNIFSKIGKLLRRFFISYVTHPLRTVQKVHRDVNTMENWLAFIKPSGVNLYSPICVRKSPRHL